MIYTFRTILVTGAAGFIGCNFVQMLAKNYPFVRIISLDKLTYAGNEANLASVAKLSNHVFVKGDIADSQLVSSLLQDYEVDTIVHFAAESHVDNSINNPLIFLQTNVIGTFSLLEAARVYWLEKKGWDKQNSRFHHVSTDEVYGSLTQDEDAFTEKSPYQPNSPYSASKASSDHLVRAYYHTYQLPVTTSNCSNNYGPYQHQEKLIPTVIHCCIKQKPIPVYGNGLNRRDWLYVADHCQAIDLILKKGQVGEVYNIGGNHELDNLSLIKQICRIMDDFIPQQAPHEALISFVADRKGHDKRYAINNHKIYTGLGFRVSGEFSAHLLETVKFYLNQIAQTESNYAL